MSAILGETRTRFTRREKELFGWKITYLDEDGIELCISRKLAVECKKNSPRLKRETPCKKGSSCGKISLNRQPTRRKPLCKMFQAKNNLRGQNCQGGYFYD